VVSTLVGSGLPRTPGEELLDLVDQPIRVADPGQLIHPVEFDQLRREDVVRQVVRLGAGREQIGPVLPPRGGPVAEPAVGPVHHESRHANRREHISDVDRAFIRSRESAAPGLAA
jgi:hypothetical protein